MERDFTTNGIKGELRCPFAQKLAKKSPYHHKEPKHPLSLLPTATDDDDQFYEDPIAVEFHATDAKPAPSVSQCAPKCPIRYLDAHSPEEVAQYFQNHKHEIPRSHAVCVQRYQSNAASIRQLDAKYGDLVSMIQGLGLKHQPLLPTEDRSAAKAESHESDKPISPKPMSQVEQWAQKLGASRAGSDAKSDERRWGERSRSQSRARTPKYERPLRDVRLGESPSRPWGIPVPETQKPSASAAEEAPDEGPTEFVPRSLPPTPGGDDDPADRPWSAGVGGDFGPSQAGDEDDGPGGFPTPRPGDRGWARKGDGNDAGRSGPPQVIFNGPVFLGYSAEDAAAMLQNFVNAVP